MTEHKPVTQVPPLGVTEDSAPPLSRRVGGLNALKALVRSLGERLTEAVCRRAFSSPEALAYELTIAPALVRVIAPEVISRVRGTRVLDVGCGSGGLGEALLRRDESLHYTGVDPSRAEIRRVARRTVMNVRGAAVQARAEALPFPDASFDTVLSCCAWKHWKTGADGLAELARTTRPSGKIVVIEIDGASSASDFARFAYRSRVPLGLRRAYVRFAMRTVVGVAPNADALVRSFADCALHVDEVRRIGDMPFTLVVGHHVGDSRGTSASPL